jgi:hypothetical protein
MSVECKLATWLLMKTEYALREAEAETPMMTFSAEALGKMRGIW